MLALAKAVMLEPELLLIDELSLGLAPLVVQELLAVVERLKAEGLTMVIVEQSVNVALGGRGPGASSWSGAASGSRAPRDELLERDDLLRAGVPLGRGRLSAHGARVSPSSNDIVWRGIVNGLVYALVALGLVLVFRAVGRHQLRAGPVRRVRRAT